MCPTRVHFQSAPEPFVEAMALAEVLHSAHFKVAGGLVPSIQRLHKEINDETCDWADERHEQHRPALYGNNGLREDPQVQAAVLRIWDLFSKRRDNTVGQEEYESFIRRIVRVLIPGLDVGQECKLARNTWEEVAGNASEVGFASFHHAMVRLGKMWTNSRHPEALSSFLEDLRTRVTRAKILRAETGEEVEVSDDILVTFAGQNGNLEWTPPECDFGTNVVVEWRGKAPIFQLEPKVGPKSFVQTGANYCIYEESARNPYAEAAPSDGVVRVWAPLDSIMPIGRAVLVALRQAEASAKEGPLDLDLSDVTPPVESPIEGARVLLSRMLPSGGGSVSVSVASGGAAIVEGSGHLFGITDLLGAGLAKGNVSNSIIVTPRQTSVLYKLDLIRRGLRLKQPRAAVAALHADGGADGENAFRLPTFTNVLKNEVELDTDSGVVKPVRTESLLESGSISALAESYVNTHADDIGLPSSLSTASFDIPDARQPRRLVGQASAAAAKFLAGFPVPAESLCNDDVDLLSLARTSPVALWVFGQSDGVGEYKTEVCRRLASSLGLQWLQPSYLLELAVKTPVKRRTKLMQNCVEQLQRGMIVSIGQALSLTLEMINSVRCRTSGYVLDFPPVGPADADAVASFAQRVSELSGAKEVRWGSLFEGDVVPLPPLPPDPRPSSPPPADGDADGKIDDEDKPDDEPRGSDSADARDETAGEEFGVQEQASAANQDFQESTTDAKAQEQVRPSAPLELNPLANMMPRRLILLSMEKDELKAWRFAMSKAQRAEKERRRKEMEDAGEDLPDEEVEGEVERPTLPEEEAEQDDLFEKGAGDILRTMAPFVPAALLEPSSKKLLEMSAQSEEVDEDVEDRGVLKASEECAVKCLRDVHQLPLLRLHMDGRLPQSAAELLEVASGGFAGIRAPLPEILEGVGDEPKELLRFGLNEQQASRRWSPWKLHCPVSLYDRRLVSGQKDFAVEYAGYVFLLADVSKQRRFCNWPKNFLADPPRINAPGMHLGYVLLGPCGYKCHELAQNLQQLYGFDVVDVTLLIAQAMEHEPSDAVDAVEGKAQVEDFPRRSEHTGTSIPRLLNQEKLTLLEGKALGTDSIVRLVACALKVDGNLDITQRQQTELAAAKKALEDAEAAGEGKPAHIIVTDDGEPIIELSGAIRSPERGFVITGFPESAEHLQALQTQLRLDIDRVLVLKMSGEDVGAQDQAQFLAKQGYGETLPLGPVLEVQMANFDGLQAVEGLRFEDVPLNAETVDQVVHIRKLIDPFYAVVMDPSVAADIPDPDDWNLEEASASANDETGISAEPPERPVIAWGTCGPYCPVTLKDDFWLFPGQKPYQHVFGNRVYSLASEKASAAFVAEPARFVPLDMEPALPPPRILVTGPTGSNVSRQCEMLSKVYNIYILRLEGAWLQEVAKRLEEVKTAKRKREQEEGVDMRLLDDDGEPVWLPGWAPKEPVDGEEEAADQEADVEEHVPEDDGLDDEAREALYIEAMRSALGSHCGACIIDGTFFSDLANEELSEEAKYARSLHNLLIKARRLPDITIILRCKHDLAFSNVYDATMIDKEDEELREMAKSQNTQQLRTKLAATRLISDERKLAFKAYLDELEGTEEGPPDPLPEPPEDLIAPEENESDRVKAKFIERKTLEQETLKDFAKALADARAPLSKIYVDRGEDPTHKGLRWHCRQFLEERGSLLLRHQAAKVSPTKAADLTTRALALPSRFKDANPLALDRPLFAGRPDAFKHVAMLRNRLYYPRSEDELQRFLEHPQDFVRLPLPSLVDVHPAVAVCGLPLAGKTSLARQLAERSGAVYIAVPEVITELCSLAALPCSLSREIMHFMRKGSQVPDASIVEALRWRLASPDVLRRGWVLDDFPLTVEQAKALEEADIVPHLVLVVNVPEGLVFSRATEMSRKALDLDMDRVQHEPALQRERLAAYWRNSPQLRTFYDLTYANVRDIDGCRSAWAMYDHALRETSLSVSRRLEYYRRTAQGLAACVNGICFTPLRVLGSESVWRQYCPVALTLGNELVPCKDTRFTVEYKLKIYWLSSAEYTKLFMDDPESFLQVPLPAAVPQLLTATERRTPLTCQLEDYCPVALVDRKELVKASGHHIVRFMAKTYSFQSKEAAAKFMRRPMRYVQRAKLPSKRPALKGDHTISLLASLAKGREGRGLEPAEMLSFMQASVAELICQALVDSGEKRPLYPGRTAHESALLFLAKFLRAKNPLNTEMFSAKVRAQFDDFLSDCALPRHLAELAKQKEEVPNKSAAWTTSDSRTYKELCNRFDEIFNLSA